MRSIPGKSLDTKFVNAVLSLEPDNLYMPAMVAKLISGEKKEYNQWRVKSRAWIKYHCPSPDGKIGHWNAWKGTTWMSFIDPADRAIAEGLPEHLPVTAPVQRSVTAQATLPPLFKRGRKRVMALLTAAAFFFAGFVASPVKKEAPTAWDHMSYAEFAALITADRQPNGIDELDQVGVNVKKEGLQVVKDNEGRAYFLVMVPEAEEERP